jgi:hypothetical protein
VALVRNYASEEPGASFIRVTKIGELGTTQAATSNRRTLKRNTRNIQKTPFFIVTAVKTSNLTLKEMLWFSDHGKPIFGVKLSSFS